MSININYTYRIPILDGLDDWTDKEDEILLKSFSRFGIYLHETIPFGVLDEAWDHIANCNNRSIPECQIRFVVYYSNILPFDDLKRCILNIEINDKDGQRTISFSYPKSNTAD